MKIAITCPSLSVPHGGIRIIVEWANRLSVNHSVSMFCRKGVQSPVWIKLLPTVKITNRIEDLKQCDTLIICSPHDIDLVDLPGMPKRIFFFLQMLEHLFRPEDDSWYKTCRKMYGCDLPTFMIGQWNIDYIKKAFPYREKNLHYIGNGVNLQDFPIDKDYIKGKHTVLVEGWESINPSKDPDAIAPTVAQMLREDGYHILAYGQVPLNRFTDTPHEYFFRPSLQTLNQIYNRATILIKASRYDARACAPMEAMTKGCVTVRALDLGDDDLIHDVNCIRIPYGNEADLYREAKNLLTDNERLSRLMGNCYEYVQKYSWDYWMPQIEDILTHA